MRASSNFTVSIQMLMLIVAAEDRVLTSDTLSQSTGANPVLIRQLYTKLKKAGIIQVSTGQGITTLSKAPEEITLWDIYAAVDKPDVDDVFKFHPKISPECQIGHFFKEILSPHLESAIQAMAEEMSKVTLLQLKEEWDTVQKGYNESGKSRV